MILEILIEELRLIFNSFEELGIKIDSLIIIDNEGNKIIIE